MGHVRMSRQQHKDLLAIQARARRAQRHNEVFGLKISDQATRHAPSTPGFPMPDLPRNRTSTPRAKEKTRRVAAVVKPAKKQKKAAAKGKK